MASRILQELKRRKVVQVAVVYAVVGFGVAQVADVMLPNLGLPGWTVTLVVALVVLGFPLALVLSWMFDVTPEGVERTESVAGWGPTAAVTPTPAVVAAPRTSIAILPFTNMSDSADNEYFSDGITEDILAQAALIGALHVISHTTARRYKKTDKSVAEIAAELGVGCVVEGSVRRSGDRVRVVAQLIDASTDGHLWAETYDRDLTDIFAVQTDVAKKIAAALQAQLTDEELQRLEERPTDSVEAYDLVLKARAATLDYTEASLKQAIEFCERALDIQPDYREALVTLGGSLFNGSVVATIEPREQERRVDRLRQTLRRLDPGSFEAHFLAGALESWLGWDWSKAQRELDAAIALEPTSIWPRARRALTGIYMGESADVVDLVLQPPAFRAGDPMCEEAAGVLLVQSSRFREGLALLEPWLVREPRHLLPPVFGAIAHTVLGDPEQGLRLAERANEVATRSALVAVARTFVLVAMGRREDAGEITSKLLARSEEEYVPPYGLALMLMVTGDVDGALDQLERAVREKAPNLPLIGQTGRPTWRPLYSHPRFQAVFQAVFPGRELPTA